MQNTEKAVWHILISNHYIFFVLCHLFVLVMWTGKNDNDKIMLEKNIMLIELLRG